MKLFLTILVFVVALAATYDVRFAIPPPKDHVAILWMLRNASLGDMVITGINNTELEVYHISNVSYRHQVSRITYQEYRILNIKPIKPIAAPRSRLKTPVCPDDTVEYVSATAYPQYPSALNYTVANYELAMNMGYNSQILVGPAATMQNYLDYLSCPNLGGFNNIGHGDQGEIFVYDGALTSDDFSTLNFQNRTTIVFNSCNVMNDPMSTVMQRNGARFFAGGISDLMIGTSEPVTYCFWNATFQGKTMTETMELCSELDPMDIWGSEDPSGQQTFQP